jgi:16S rRNA (guanine966-N2)-methyltransferase
MNKFELKEYRVKTRQKKLVVQFKDKDEKKRDITIKILGGLYANRRIKLFSTTGLRPTLMRTKVVMFDTLKFEEGLTFLDVFAGSGSIGLEALSRGASKVIFFDISSKYVKSIQKNIDDMPNVPGIGSVFCVNVFRPPQGRPMNVVFLDPPYADSGLIPDVLNKLLKHNWIDENTIIITETDQKTVLNKLSANDDMLSKYNVFNEKRISSTMLKFWKYNQDFN